MYTNIMNMRQSSRKRESVFKAHVLERLYSSENTAKDEAPSGTPTNSQTTQSRLADVKLYTVQLPPDGLPDGLPEDKFHSNVSCFEAESSSDVSEDEEQPPKKRKRKKKHRKGTSESASAVTNPTTTSKGDEQSQTLKTESSSSSQPTDTSSLTKNQRRKLRKKRAKLGRLQNKPPVQATEFTCDVDAQGPGRGDVDSDDEGSGDKATREVIEFIEAVWRLYSCDASKAKSVHSFTQQFQTTIDKISNGELSKEAVICLRDVKRMLVLQDFPRARMKLVECRDIHSNTSELENILLFSTLAEYWMTDIAASDSTSGNVH